MQISYAQKIVIHSKSGGASALEPLVEQFISDGVRFAAVVGKECALMGEIID